VSGGGLSVVSIGTYDGFHLGHQRLIGEATAEAARLGLRTVVVTFDRHPSVTIRPESAPPLITDLDLKLELIEGAGVDEVVVLDFDAERANETPEAFAADLVTDLEATVVLVGENFRFGHDHRGDVAMLEHLGSTLGFSARGIPLVTDVASQAVVSSRHIRERIAAGALGDVERFLGRRYELRGLWSTDGVTGTVTVGAELARPPAGEYEVALREPGRSPSATTVTATLGADGTAVVPLDGTGITLDEGDLLGLVISSGS
jgi:riboflavin kinase / FMN adenylyltransferase